MPGAKLSANEGHDVSPPMLSQFEFEILRLMLDDCNVGQISDQLGISATTTHIAVEGIMRGLGTTTIAGTAARAMRLGIIV